MQNTKQNNSAEFITKLVWNFMSHVGGNISIGEIFTPTLAILYALHKGYGLKMSDHSHLEFVPNRDRLYQDLVNLVPNDRHLHAALCEFAREFCSIDRNDFNSVYVEVLRNLFDLVSSNSGRQGGEFYTPSAITKLMAYFVSKEKCQKVFDPFCGTASIVHDLSTFGGQPQFNGHEINYQTSIYARLIVEAIYGYDYSIRNKDSIICSDVSNYDAVVSCPPFNLRLTQKQLNFAWLHTPEWPCRSYEEFLLGRPFNCNHAKLTITLLPTSFCFRGNNVYELRKELIERNLVDMLIALPANILYGTSIPCVILVCKSGRNLEEPIKFIHAEDYFLGDHRKRTFDYNRFIEMFEGDRSDIANISLDEVRHYDYNLNPSLYYTKDVELKDGQKACKLRELLTLVDGKRIPSSNVKEEVSISNLSRNFIDVLLNNGKVATPSEISSYLDYRVYAASDKKYLLALSNRYGIYTNGKEFVCRADVKVFEVNDTLVTPEYLVHTLLNHKAFNIGRMPLSGFMMLTIVIDSLPKQKEIVHKISQEHAAFVRAEQEADAKRLGVKTNISDLEHLLQTTHAYIDDIIEKLEDFHKEDNSYQSLIKGLKDNVEYMKRVIRFSNATIYPEMFNMKRYDIDAFIKNYCNSWLNYSGKYFYLSLKSMLGENRMVVFDKTYIKLMLDSILTNVERHGFKKRRKEENHVEISLSVESYQDNSYVVIRVANNGEPFKEGFTLNDYITRGRYTSNTGRSGLGGYHVYQIAKGHNGYLYIDSNKVWNVVIEILLPIEGVKSDNLVIYEHECI